MTARLVIAACVVALACNKPTASGASANEAASPPTPSIVDDATSRTCRATYSCGLSHPGLGSSMRATSVDLATCERSTSSSSGPFEGPSQPGPSTKTPLASVACEHLRKLVAAITAKDVRDETEPAQIDMEACSLVVSCAPDFDKPRISVQRQSPSSGHVGQVIRAL